MHTVTNQYVIITFVVKEAETISLKRNTVSLVSQTTTQPRPKVNLQFTLVSQILTKVETTSSSFITTLFQLFRCIQGFVQPMALVSYLDLAHHTYVKALCFNYSNESMLA